METSKVAALRNGGGARPASEPPQCLQMLTAPSWPGLPVGRCERSGRDQRLDIDVPDSVLVLHESGQADIEVRRHPFAWRFSAVPGSFDFYPAGSYDAYLCGPPPTRALVVVIPHCFERRVVQQRAHASPLSPRFQFHDRRLQRLVLALVECAAGPGGQEEVALSLAIVDRLHEAMAQPPEGAARLSPLVRHLIAEQLERDLSTPVDVGRAARLTGMGRTQFSEAFRHSFGETLHQYVLARRIASAKERLLGAGRSLTDVAHELGFASHAHFSTVFKSRVGVTPSQFREEHGG